MKFIYVCDLHSNKELYNSLKELIFNTKPDILIIGGDIFAYSSSAKPQLEFAKGYLEEFIKAINIPVYIISGNCDRPIAVEYLHEMQECGLINILSLAGTIINDIKFIGYEYIQPSPFKIKDWERRDLVEDYNIFDFPCFLSNENDKLDSVDSDFLNNLQSIEDDLSMLHEEKSIWVMHAPPYGGILDINYEGIYSGSKAIRKAVEKVQPILTLHGHIHEAPTMSQKWAQRIGNTISINPGSTEVFHGVIGELNNNGDVIYLKHTIYGELVI